MPLTGNYGPIIVCNVLKSGVGECKLLLTTNIQPLNMVGRI